MTKQINVDLACTIIQSCQTNNAMRNYKENIKFFTNTFIQISGRYQVQSILYNVVHIRKLPVEVV